MKNKGEQEVEREQGQVRIVGERRMIPVVHLTCEYLNELNKKFEITLMLFSCAWG